MYMTSSEVKAHLDGVLAFALTPFAADGSIAEPQLREHVEMLLSTGCRALFAAGGTGEFFSLSLSDYEKVVRTCVSQVHGRLPVIAGVGYGTAMAREFATVAEQSGADGLLVLPPYLTDAPQRGLVDHYRAVAAVTDLATIVYQRANAVFDPGSVAELTEDSNCIGFKEGLGDIDRLQRVTAAVGDRLVYMNGMPTAEIYAAALAQCGVTTYSSAILTFLPEVATAFGTAFKRRDSLVMQDLLDRAILPFADIRRRSPGYAVALVKAGARLRGVEVGSVRPPLADPSPSDLADLQDLLRRLDLGTSLAAPVRPV